MQRQIAVFSQCSDESCTKITSKQLSQLKGKYKGLRRLLKHPRADSPELKPFVHAITLVFRTLIMLGLQSEKSLFEKKMEMIRPVEQLLIRVIAGGKDFEMVKKEVFSFLAFGLVFE